MKPTPYLRDCDVTCDTFPLTGLRSIFLPFLFQFSLSFIILLFFFSGATAHSDLPKIGVTRIIDHPALNATEAGVWAELTHQGFERGVTLKGFSASAQGNPAMASQIAQSFAGGGAQVIVTLGTVSSQAAVPVAKRQSISVVFGSVTDPLTSKLVNTLKAPEGRVTGVSNLTPLRPQLDLFRALVPDLKQLGIIYNPGEANSLSLIRAIQEEGAKMGLQVVLSPAMKSSDVSQAAKALVGKAQAIFINNDNTALSALNAIVDVGRKNHLPVFVSDTDSVSQGAVAALGPDQYALGRQVGRMVAELLRGKTPKELPVEFPEKVELFLNLEAAGRIGLKVPQELLRKANVILREK